MGRLLLRSEIDIINLPVNVLEARIDPYIKEAEDNDIRRFLGEEMYYALVTAAADSPFTSGVYYDLLNGKNYLIGDDTVEFRGLKKAIQYYAYARYLIHHDMSHTSTGVHIHLDETTERPSDQSIKMKVDQARSLGANVLSEAKTFLNENSSSYPLWNCTGKLRGGFRATVVGMK